MLKQLIELAAAIAGALLIGGAIIAILNWDKIEEWFDSHKSEIDNKDKVARTILDCYSDGNYGVRYGVFNKRTDSFISSESVKCKSVDSVLERKHNYGRTRIVDHII